MQLNKSVIAAQRIAFGAFQYHFRLVAPPVIIGGCGRSGTTLLLSLLSSHPEIFAIGDETTTFCPGAYSPNFDPTRKHPIRLRYFYPQFAGLGAHHSATRWCEKTPKNVWYFAEILNFFKRRVKIIHMVRDGRDVVMSRHPSQADSTWVSADRWTREVEEGLRFLKEPEVLTVRYEDLVLEFKSTIKKIERFLDVRPFIRFDSWLETATVKTAKSLDGPVGPIHDESIGKWKSTAPTIDRNERVAGIGRLLRNPESMQLLHRLGYCS